MDSRRAAIWRIAIGGVVVSAVFLGMIVTGSVPSPDEVRDYGDSLGLLAVLAFVPLFVPANFLISWPILSGNVHSWFERDEARHAAWGAPGVKEVDDRIAIVP